MNSILNGKVYTHDLAGWRISWESAGDYRHWCLQEQPGVNDEVLVVMFNPGSLQGDGKNLKRDTTLRILREVFRGTELNPFIINLFDYATTSPSNLFKNWHKRDGERLIYRSIRRRPFRGLVLAYGDYEFREDYGSEIEVRIRLIKRCFRSLPDVVLPKNKSGAPKHPKLWQMQNHKTNIRRIIMRFSRNIHSGGRNA